MMPSPWGSTYWNEANNSYRTENSRSAGSTVLELCGLPVQVFSPLVNLLCTQTAETLPRGWRQLRVTLPGRTMETLVPHMEKSFTADGSRNMDKMCGRSPRVGHLDGHCHCQDCYLTQCVKYLLQKIWHFFADFSVYLTIWHFHWLHVHCKHINHLEFFPDPVAGYTLFCRINVYSDTDVEKCKNI